MGALVRRLPQWSLKTWGALFACLSALPTVLALVYAWRAEPYSSSTVVWTACVIASALGVLGFYALVHTLAAEIKGIAAESLSISGAPHPVREIGEVIAASQAATRTIRSVHASVLRAEESERRRLARELHDELGQELAVLHMRLRTTSGADVHLSAQVLSECESLSGDILERVRSMALDLRPAQLDDLGLPAALRTLARRVGKQTGITVTLLAVPESTQRFADAVETALFRIAQAAVTNAVRHAGATTLWIGLELEDGRATVKVQDDGSGFDLDAVNAKAAAGAGMGLLVMNERVHALGGTMEIITAPGTGTLVKASLPIDAEEVP